MLKTLAGKHRSSVSKMAAQVQGHDRHTARAAHVLRGQRRTRQAGSHWSPGSAAFRSRRQKNAVLTDRQPAPAAYPPQGADRPAPGGQVRDLRATDNVQVHHVRKLADLDQPGQPQPGMGADSWPSGAARPSWSAPTCHDPSTPGSPPHAHAVVTGEPDARKRSRPVRREAARKRTRTAGTSPAAYLAGWADGIHVNIRLSRGNSACWC